MTPDKSVTAETLTLEIDGPRITAEKFEAGIDAFLTILKDVSKDVTGKTRAVKWFVSVSPGSIKIEFTPQARDIAPATLNSVVDTIEYGIVSVEADATLPPHFSERAMTSVRKLAAILDGTHRDLDRVQIWRNGTPHPISTRALANVDSFYGIESRDWGTIEGILDGVYDRQGLKCTVLDILTNRRVKCFVGDDLLDEVLDAFDKRVSVSGVIRYRRHGEPDSIDIQEFSLLPAPEELPTFEEVRGILKGTE